MASRKAIQGLKQVKPILSINQNEAKLRVLNLYKAWYRQIPYICKEYDLDLTEERCKKKLREKFYQNKHVDDIRVIDLLCHKGQQDLMECKNIWKQRNHVMTFFNETVNEKPDDFLGKFYDGHRS